MNLLEKIIDTFDGVIIEEEAKKIEKLRKELNLSPEHSKSLVDIMTDKKK